MKRLQIFSIQVPGKKQAEFFFVVPINLPTLPISIRRPFRGIHLTIMRDWNNSNEMKNRIRRWICARARPRVHSSLCGRRVVNCSLTKPLLLLRPKWNDRNNCNFSTKYRTFGAQKQQQSSSIIIKARAESRNEREKNGEKSRKSIWNRTGTSVMRSNADTQRWTHTHTQKLHKLVSEFHSIDLFSV